MKKQHLPEKICPACGRPFQWRKKWERNWEEVKYCSGRCRHSRTPTFRPSNEERPTNNKQQ